jgi:hypothetical protein
MEACFRRGVQKTKAKNEQGKKMSRVSTENKIRTKEWAIFFQHKNGDFMQITFLADENCSSIPFCPFSRAGHFAFPRWSCCCFLQSRQKKKSVSKLIPRLSVEPLKKRSF